MFVDGLGCALDAGDGFAPVVGAAPGVEAGFAVVPAAGLCAAVFFVVERGAGGVQGTATGVGVAEIFAA